MAFVTPLRYPGGKGRLAAWLGELISNNKLAGCTYVEPFAGGAGAAMSLLSSGMVGRIVINDIDPLIANFWSVLFKKGNRLAELVRSNPATMLQWEASKAVVSQPAHHDDLELAFAAFFVNRTSRSGILSGGVIGGRGQSGKYKLNARYNADQLGDRIEHLYSLRRKASVFQLDAKDLLSDLAGQRRKMLIYCDPPYYTKGSQLYINHYGPRDHRGIADSMSNIRHPWLVTYDDCSAIKRLYTGIPRVRFNLPYSTHKQRPRATEVMFYNNLTLSPDPYLRR